MDRARRRAARTQRCRAPPEPLCRDPRRHRRPQAARGLRRHPHRSLLPHTRFRGRAAARHDRPGEGGSHLAAGRDGRRGRRWTARFSRPPGEPRGVPGGGEDIPLSTISMARSAASTSSPAPSRLPLARCPWWLTNRGRSGLRSPPPTVPVAQWKASVLTPRPVPPSSNGRGRAAAGCVFRHRRRCQP